MKFLSPLMLSLLASTHAESLVRPNNFLLRSAEVYGEFFTAVITPDKVALNRLRETLLQNKISNELVRAVIRIAIELYSKNFQDSESTLTDFERLNPVDANYYLAQVYLPLIDDY